MYSAISVSHKFMDLPPEQLIDMFCVSRFTRGIELYCDGQDDSEVSFLDSVLTLALERSLPVTVHGEINTSLERQIELLRHFAKRANYLDQPIIVTLHPTNDTEAHFNALLPQIDEQRVIVALENLNHDGDIERPNKAAIIPFIKQQPLLYFTYDIGHDLVDNHHFEQPAPILVDKLKNIHLHDYIGREDHQPIYANSDHLPEIANGIAFLKNINYTGSIVFEYNLYACSGETLTEKVQDYLNSIDFVSEKYILA